MIAFRMKIYFKTLRATWDTFGFGRELLIHLFRRPLNRALNSILQSLDEIVVPRYRSVKVEHPLFIIGHPRSGTTFLHRVMTQTREFAVFEFWELLFPAIVTRRPIERRVKAKVRSGDATVYPPQVGHELAMDSVEEEELLFMHKANTQFLTLHTALAFSRDGFDEIVYSDRQPEAVRRETCDFFKRCLQRQIFFRGRTQVITKMNYSGMRMRSLLETFPDAKIVYVVRSPLDAIPSHLSLHRNMFDHHWGLGRIPADRLREYYERRYRYNVDFYRYMEELIEAGVLTPERCLILTYDEMNRDLEGTVRRVASFAGLTLSGELWGKIRKESDDQKNYRRKHGNLDLQQFGLTRERIVADLGFVFDKYGFAR